MFVVGGEVGEDGKETIRCLNKNAVFAYAVSASQELHQVVKQQQMQIDEQKQQIDRLIDIILISCFSSCNIIRIDKINLLAVS